MVESVFRSGTSVTAKLALSQNRKVFALPHEIWNTHGIGTNTLLKNGAILVTSSSDILQEFKSLKKLLRKINQIEKVDLSLLDSKCELFQNFSNSSDYTSELEKLSFKPTTINIHTDTLNISSSLSNTNNIIFANPLKDNLTHFKTKKIKNPTFQEIYSLITNEPISINTLCKKTSKSISEVSSILFSLELEGYIKKIAGGYICISNK